MIAAFCRHRWQARALATPLTSLTEEVEGPWWLLKGRFRRQETRIFVVAERADAAYAAGRLAARRGAQLLLPVSQAWMPLHEAELDQGAAPLLPVREIWDLQGLQPLLHLLSETADRLPLELRPLLPERPAWALEGSAQDDGAAVGTLPHPTGNARLADRLRARRGIQALDFQLAGFAAAATDEPQVSLLPFAMVRPLAAVRATEDGPRESAEQALNLVLEQLPD